MFIPVSDQDFDDANLVNAILDVHEEDPEFGQRSSPRIWSATVASSMPARIWRLCRGHGIASVISKPTEPGKTPGPAVQDDHVKRRITAGAPNQLWLADSVASLLPSRAPHR